MSRSDSQADVGLDLTGDVTQAAPTAVCASRGKASLAECHRPGRLAMGIFIVQSSSASASTRR